MDTPRESQEGLTPVVPVHRRDTRLPVSLFVKYNQEVPPQQPVSSRVRPGPDVVRDGTSRTEEVVRPITLNPYHPDPENLSCTSVDLECTTRIWRSPKVRALYTSVEVFGRDLLD